VKNEVQQRFSQFTANQPSAAKKHCAQCGAVLEASARFCSCCGAAQEEPTAVEAATVEEDPVVQDPEYFEALPTVLENGQEEVPDIFGFQPGESRPVREYARKEYISKRDRAMQYIPGTKDISPYAKVSESETLEYKSSFAERDKIIETIVAFRNIRKASTIIVGVDNEGNIKGEKRTKEQCIDVETDFLNTVRQVKCNVKLENYIEFDWCDEGRTCHISVKRAFDNKITYFKDELVVRNGASNISLKSEEMENFIINFYSLNL
jgi:hypothetical protein